MTKSAIKSFAIGKALAGELFDLKKPSQMDRFLGSCERFSDIAFAFQGRPRVLDVGSEGGILLSLLTELGHECHAVDFCASSDEFPEVYQAQNIAFQVCNAEVDPLPYPDHFFDAVSCCQTFEHFTHSHLPTMREFHRVLKPGGILEVDVPNVASLRNRWRLLRGKSITYGFEEHYLDAKPINYKGAQFYPSRHNREFTKSELELLFRRGGFRNIEARFLLSQRVRFGIARIKSLGSWLRGVIPSVRKTLICFGTK